MDKLSSAIKLNDEELIIKNLEDIMIPQGKNIELENNEIVKDLLNINNEMIKRLATEAIAELCKNDRNRRIITDRHIIDELLSQFDSKNEEIILNTIRALVNICYENDDARKIIDKKGLIILLSYLNSDDKRPDATITLKASGFLVNLLNSNDELIKIAIQNNIMDCLEKLLKKYQYLLEEKNHMLITFLLAILDDVTDFLDDQNVSFNENLCLIIINLFKMSDFPEISIPCLEILHSQSEKDEIKLILTKNGMCELVFDLIERYRNQAIDEDSRSIMKMACDLIVTVLTGDECMSLLYDNGNGKLYKNMLKWLESTDNDLLSTGVLAIGNFARKDHNCIQIVDSGVSKILLGLLSEYNKQDSDIKVQHALLSTLKNLVIPKPNKSKLIDEGLIDVIYPIMDIKYYLVIFKLLGTFRMVIDGQEKTAYDLLNRPDFLEKLIYWCYNSDHLGVRGEVPRLISWLIKNCHSFKPLKHLIHVDDCIKCLVEMIGSNHAVMQNESFYALDYISMGLQISEDNEDEKMFLKQVIEADLGNNILFILNKYHDKMDKHTIENLLKLLEKLIRSDMIIQHLIDVKLDDVLKKLFINSNSECYADKLNSILNILEK